MARVPKSKHILSALLLALSWQAQAQEGDQAVQQYAQLEQMLALDRRCVWLPLESLERTALQVTRNERRAWLESTGRILAAELSVKDIDKKVAHIPCSGPEGDQVRQQVMRAGWELGAEWLMRAQALQASYRVSRLSRPDWFHGVDTFVSADIEPAITSLRGQVPWEMIDRAQDQALADASRWMLLLCKDWQAGLMHPAGQCPKAPEADKAYTPYAVAWRKAAGDFIGALWAVGDKQRD